MGKNISQVLFDFNDIPKELLLFRDIHHTIDLIFGSAFFLPSLSQYKINLTKHVELKRKVDGLLMNDFSKFTR